MQENRNTENAPLDDENWEIAFAPYVEYPLLALMLAQHLSALQDYIQSDAKAAATGAINRAVEELYEHSDFRSDSGTVSRHGARASPGGRETRYQRTWNQNVKVMGNKRSRPQRLAAKLLAIRQHLGLSQFKMTRLLGAEIAYHRLSEYETGRREPNLMVLLRYAQVANVSVESLIDDTLDLPF